MQCLLWVDIKSISRVIRTFTTTKFACSDRKMASEYAMQILNGQRIQSSQKFFEPLIGSDLDIGPPTSESIDRYRQSIQN